MALCFRNVTKYIFVYWKFLGPVTALTHCSRTQRIFAGLDNGTVVEYKLSEDLNHIEHVKDYLSHDARVNGLICVGEMNWIISVSKDHFMSWYSTETGIRLGEHYFESEATCLE